MNRMYDFYHFMNLSFNLFIISELLYSVKMDQANFHEK